MAIKYSSLKNKTKLVGILKGNGTDLSVAVSGTDVKTVNGTSILGSGDIVIESSGGLIWDTGVVANLNDINEATSGISFSVKAVTPFTAKTVTHSITSGSLPNGLSLGSTTGLITGTTSNITTTTTYTFTVSATDTISTISQVFTLRVIATNSAPNWTSATSLGTIVGTSIQLAATDSEGTTLTYSVITGVSPSLTGFSISSTGLVSFTTNPLNGNTYSFTAAVSDGVNTVNRSFTFLAASPPGESLYTTPGTYSWTCPAGVTSVSVFAVAGGGGGGMQNWNKCGGNSFVLNNYSVTPGSSYSVTVGAGGSGSHDAYVIGGNGGNSAFHTYTALAPTMVSTNTSTLTPGATYSYLGGSSAGGGGAGAAGSGGKGGDGSYGQTGVAGSGSSGGGGGGGAGHLDNISGAGGGGASLYGGAGGNGGSTGLYSGGAGGGGTGTPGGNGGNRAYGTATGGLYGGGGAFSSNGGSGAVRIIWGTNRSFPSNAA